MKFITIISEDNQLALESHDAAEREGKFGDVCATCPVAQALNRVMNPVEWFVNRNGARPKGSKVYWYTFSSTLTRAIDTFDQSCKLGHPTPILGTFRIKNHQDHCA